MNEREPDHVLDNWSAEGVQHTLLDQTPPLIPPGVEEEVAVYRHVNSYLRLIEQAVLGSPSAW